MASHLVAAALRTIIAPDFAVNAISKMSSSFAFCLMQSSPDCDLMNERKVLRAVTLTLCCSSDHLPIEIPLELSF